MARERASHLQLDLTDSSFVQLRFQELVVQVLLRHRESIFVGDIFFITALATKGENLNYNYHSDLLVHKSVTKLTSQLRWSSFTVCLPHSSGGGHSLLISVDLCLSLQVCTITISTVISSTLKTGI